MIDLSECRHIDAAAIGLLLDVQRRLARRRSVLTVGSRAPSAERVLQAGRLDQVLLTRIKRGRVEAHRTEDG